MSQWLKAITEARCERTEKPGAQWKTLQQIAKEMGLSRPRTASIVTELIEAKKADRKSFVISTGSVVRPVPHYRLVK